MTKIFCPIKNCNTSTFANVTSSHQIHLNRHLHHIHGITVTSQNISAIRRQQNEAWRARVDELEAARSGQVKRFREEFEAFARDPRGGVPSEGFDGGVVEELARLMDVVDDERVEEEGAREVEDARAVEAKRDSEWFGQGPGYDVSCRTHQVKYVQSKDVQEKDGREKVDRDEEEEVAEVLAGRMRQTTGLPNGSGLDKASSVRTKKARDSIAKGK